MQSGYQWASGGVSSVYRSLCQRQVVVIVDICWLEVLGEAVAAFGEVELLGDMAGMWVWKGKVSKCSDLSYPASGLSNHVVNTTCCSSHSQRKLSLPHLPRYWLSSHTKRYVTADNGFSGPLPVAA